MDDILKDMGATETQTVEQPPVEQQPQTQVTQPVQQPTQQPTIQAPITDEVLSLNDEPIAANPKPEGEQVLPSVEADWGAKLNEWFGVSEPEQIKAQLAELTASKEQLEKPRYQTSFAEYVDKAVQKYGDPREQAEAFRKLTDVLTTNAETLDDRAALEFQMKQEYPSLTNDEIATLLEGKYNLNDYATDEQKKLGQVQMKLDAQKAKLNIKQMQADAFKDAPTQATLKGLDEQKRQLEWETKHKEVAKSIKAFEFEVEKGKKMKFDIPQNDYTELEAVAKEVALKSGILPDSQGAKQLEEIVKMTYIYQNAGKLISNAYKKGLSQANAEWSQKVHNPSGLLNTRGPEAIETNKTIEEQQFDWLASQIGK